MMCGPRTSAHLLGSNIWQCLYQGYVIATLLFRKVLMLDEVLLWPYPGTALCAGAARVDECSLTTHLVGNTGSTDVRLLWAPQ